MSDDTSIVNLITDRVVETLTVDMTDLVAVDDPTRAGLIRSGKLQADPTIEKINILIREGGSAWPDVLIPAGYAPMSAPQNQIGGGSIWLRRLIGDFDLFFIGDVSRNEAQRRANVIMSRFRHSIAQMDTDGLLDSFGEGAIAIQVDKLESFAGGGAGTFIWRATLYFEVLTESVV